MKNQIIIMILFVIFLDASLMGMSYETGLRYGIGISSRGQSPQIEGYNEKITFLNIMVANELVLNELFRLELDLMFNERGFAERKGDMTSHSLYYLDIPIMIKIYPLKFLYMGTGVGYALKLKTRDYDSNKYAELMHGYDNFVDAKTKKYEFNFALSLGCCYRITNNISLIGEFRHNYSLTNINSHRGYEFLNKDLEIKEKFRTLYFFIGFNYRVI